jgi:hypothetical protein
MMQRDATQILQNRDMLTLEVQLTTGENQQMSKYSVFAVLRTRKKYLMNWADQIKVPHTSRMTTR